MSFWFINWTSTLLKRKNRKLKTIFMLMSINKNVFGKYKVLLILLLENYILA